MTQQNTQPTYLQTVKKLVYNTCGFEMTNILVESEGKAYDACSFLLDDQAIIHRTSKITPTKSGQFVTLWKRNNKGITIPFDSKDSFDFIVITAKNDNQLGQFIFPKSVLINKGIITHNGKVGKRGIRVYPPWAITSNKQATITQQWQTNYFLEIENGKMNFDLAKRLFASKI